MSRLIIDGQEFQCTQKDLARWDERAAKSKTTRETEAAAELMPRSAPKAPKAATASAKEVTR